MLQVVKKYRAYLVLILAIGSLLAGITLREYEMLFSYAVIVCLNCIGIG